MRPFMLILLSMFSACPADELRAEVCEVTAVEYIDHFNGEEHTDLVTFSGDMLLSATETATSSVITKLPSIFGRTTRAPRVGVAISANRYARPTDTPMRRLMISGKLSSMRI